MVLSVQKVAPKLNTNIMVEGFLDVCQVLCIDLAKQEVEIVQKRAERVCGKPGLASIPLLKIFMFSLVFEKSKATFQTLLKYSGNGNLRSSVTALLWLSGCLV